MNKTIFALSSGGGRAGVAVIRLSGTAVRSTLQTMTGKVPEPRYATLATIRDPENKAVLDKGLVLFFSGPHSFTGEDVGEFHVHGGPAVVEGLLACLARQPDLVAAGPGQFTRRAFDNGKLDLTQVEGLADLIEAETPQQAAQALRQMDGALSRLYEGWRTALVRALAYGEAGLDFSDEEVPEDLMAAVKPDVAVVAQAITVHLADGGVAQRLRDGVTVVLTGKPNVGKSSLLNRLAQSDAAIVSARPGTTRDVVKARIALDGVPVTLVDTAGIRDAEDEIEAEGVRRAERALEEADLVLHVLDASEEDPAMFHVKQDDQTLIIAHKSDLNHWQQEAHILPVSSKTGEGMEILLHTLSDRLGLVADAQGGQALTRTRHRQALEDCLVHLNRFMAQTDTVLAAEDLRLAIRDLGRITGRVDVEDLLDVIFADFCIGK